MSDLISRSALIKHFEAIQQQENVVGLEFVAMIDEIKEQPTAYDIDKVVEELPDDVCEWELKNVCYTTSIKHYYSLPTSIVKTFNNCPYCGKKIKIVGD